MDDWMNGLMDGCVCKNIGIIQMNIIFQILIFKYFHIPIHSRFPIKILNSFPRTKPLSHKVEDPGL
ncbi:MAG: hypothetical protein A2X48_05550 [Lentisphaerae bacterium GWF2_49_21]|nr:MAG: hypothetical protein A2X48_05550 [Lentisphaerae bacterium GWF2_49_21]